MRVATITYRDALHTARIGDDGSAVLLAEGDLGSLLQQTEGDIASLSSGDPIAAAEWRFSRLVNPRKVVCVGLNYRSHIIEMGRDLPTHPALFAKFPDTLCGASDDIVLDRASTGVDWEAELTVVIGRTARRVDEANALAHIAGYTVANDVSMRDWQRRTIQWMQGKNFEASTPVAAVMVTPDDVNHAADLRISTTVNGELMQESSTSDLLFGPAALVAYISTFTTLNPGDLILTGTPGGVGEARTPPRFIQHDDIVEVSIDGIGSCRNRFVADR
jgi:acylpyruvate hydrolase